MQNIAASKYKQFLEVAEGLDLGDIYDIMQGRALDYVKDPSSKNEWSLAISCIMFFIKKNNQGNDLEVSINKVNKIIRDKHLIIPCKN